MTQEMTGFCDDSGISWTICKQSAPCSRQITTTPHHSIFTGWMLFMAPNQQCQSSEGTSRVYTLRPKKRPPFHLKKITLSTINTF